MDSKVERPYQLKQPQYGLWYEVGEKLGRDAQNALEGVLCRGAREFISPHSQRPLDYGTKEAILAIAKDRGVILSLS